MTYYVPVIYVPKYKLIIKLAIYFIIPSINSLNMDHDVGS